MKKSPDPPVLPTDLQLAASTSDTRPPTPTCTAWRVVWVSTCHHVLFHGHNHVLFHVLEQCRLLSLRLRAHTWSTLARLCPVHLFNLGAETGVLGKGLLHKPFPHHYQGRIDFNTVNPCHSTGMDLMSIPAGRVVLANPVPRAKIFQSCP